MTKREMKAEIRKMLKASAKQKKVLDRESDKYHAMNRRFSVKIEKLQAKCKHRWQPNLRGWSHSNDICLICGLIEEV